ncbi:MAG: epoxyqueuosine reductase [Deltaproteobacteria bacterium]|nr:epoxyqueuosine reductase [Deltaproteobacteria bacterium]MBW2086540.1 epoxyqueuosine reductase [Deltaproteobacteria bacterium]
MNEQFCRFIQELFATNELNRLPEGYGSERIFATPLFGVSRGDDHIFMKFKEVVAPEHLTPAEVWIRAGHPEMNDLAPRLRIVSIIFPYVNHIREESKDATMMPAEIYCVGRNYANAFMNDVLNRSIKFFKDQGFHATAGMLSPAFQILVKDNPPRVYSVWSERHIAFAAGLGTFSLHEGLITEAGCNIRVSSVITDAPLEVTPRRSDEPYANCLYYAKGTCRECEARCPGGAITEEGHDKVKCNLYGRIVSKEMTNRLGNILKPHPRRINNQDVISYPVGCAFCQFGVPCMDRNPMAKEQKKDQT